MPKPFSVLIVEDNPTDILLIQEALRSAGVEPQAVVFSDGDEAFHYIDRPDSLVPEVAILDLHLPKRDGSEVLARMRANSRFRRVPAIILSSSPQGVMVDHAAHADGHITKPGDLDAFLAVGTQVLNIVRAVSLAA